jgi:magnesium-transporting ATPase (P-type)
MTTTKEEAANGGTHNDAAAAAAATKDEAAKTTTRPPPPPMVPDSRFGGLAGAVEASVASSMERNLGSLTAPFPVTPQELGLLSNERTRVALADLLEKGVKKQGASEGDQEGDAAAGEVDEDDDDIEALPEDHRAFQKNRTQLMRRQVMTLVEKMREAEAQKQAAGADGHGHSGGGGAEDAAQQAEADKHADVAANVLTSVLLRSSPESGIDPREVEHRRAVFGSNGIADKKIDSFLKLCWEAVQDFVLIMLIVLGTISIIVEVTTHEGPCTTCWIEGAAILVSVVIVVCVTAGIDYAKQFAFIRLTRSLNESNTKAVIRDAKQLSVTDEDIVVGDIISVNAHALATIPADCVLLGPPADLKMDESTLTGESKLISKMPGDVILSGTNAVQGSGKMVVIAVGVHSVAGKIRARVYESEDHEGDLEGEEEDSPLFVKLDLIAKRIGMVGTFAAAISLIGSCISGFLIVGENDKPAPVSDLVKYIVTAITVLAVAVPEGLPLAVTLALAFSSNKMMRDQNLVKHLDACETMGCATTICTDKTGE